MERYLTKSSLIVSDEEGSIIFSNKQAASTRGYSLEEFKKLHISDIKKDGTIFPEELKLLNQNKQAIFETSHKKKDGTIFPVRVRAVLTDGVIFSTVEDITEEKRKENELKQSIEIASKTQKELLPKEIDNDFFTIKNLYLPVNHLSGDFYNYTWTEKNKLLEGFILDVSGHSLATAIHTSSVNTIIKEEMRLNKTPSVVISNTNEKIQDYFPDDTFVAMMYYQFDFKKNTLTYCSGGINYFFSSIDKEKGVVTAPGSLVGILKNTEYNDIKVSFSSGDAFYFITDGFTDILNKSVNINDFNDFEKTYSNIQKKSEERRDDVSAVCIKIK